MDVTNAVTGLSMYLRSHRAGAHRSPVPINATLLPLTWVHAGARGSFVGKRLQTGLGSLEGRVGVIRNSFQAREHDTKGMHFGVPWPTYYLSRVSFLLEAAMF